MIQNVNQLTFDLIKKSLDATSERSRVIGHNITNFNTPGYKSFEVVFEEKLANSLQNNNIDLKATNVRHIDNGDSVHNISPEIKKNKSSSMRLDGNNVDIEKEMTDQAANSILYNLLISQANSRLTMRKSIINGK